MEDITKDVAEAFDDVRAEIRPAGNLSLLRGASAGGYELVLSINGGWFPEYTNDLHTGRLYIKAQIADRTEISAALADTDTLYLAVEGKVFTIQQDLTERPLTQPLLWVIYGYSTTGEWAGT